MHAPEPGTSQQKGPVYGMDHSSGSRSEREGHLKVENQGGSPSANVASSSSGFQWSAVVVQQSQEQNTFQVLCSHDHTVRTKALRLRDSRPPPDLRAAAECCLVGVPADRITLLGKYFHDKHFEKGDEVFNQTANLLWTLGPILKQLCGPCRLLVTGVSDHRMKQHGPVVQVGHFGANTESSDCTCDLERMSLLCDTVQYIAAAFNAGTPAAGASITSLRESS